MITNSLPINAGNPSLAHQTGENPTGSLALDKLKPISDGTTNNWLTSGNIIRAELCLGSAVALTASIATCIFYTTISAKAAPVIACALPVSFAVLAGYAAWQAYTTPDYDNTAEVAKYREQCKNSSLEEAFQKHGHWVSERKLLTQEQVLEKYIDESSKILTIPDLLTYDQKVKTLIKNTQSTFTLPSPKEHNQERFKKMCSTLSYDETAKLHGHKNIFDWELFSNEKFNESYLKKESSLLGLPAICDFYKTTENNRREFDVNSTYTIPNPIRLQKKIQEDCKTMSFKDIEKLHTLHYIFDWELLTPDDFHAKYQEYREYLFSTKGLNAVISHYKKTLETRNMSKVSYEIPHPQSFSNQWLALDLPLKEVLENYDLNELIEYKIIQDPSQISSLLKLTDTLKSIKSTYRQGVNKAEHESSRLVSEENERFKAEIETIRMAETLLYQNKQQKALRLKDLNDELSLAVQNRDFESVDRLKQKINQLKLENLIGGLFTPDQFSLIQSENEAESRHRSNLEQIANKKTAELATLKSILKQGLETLEQEYEKTKKP